ncbi:hypothetical protein IFT68_08220 [Oxalobacteraceae sp. CFBP 13730]|nr:hypothetical protein [Oxalobacteraceae sp. CFBP 13730]
MPKLTHWIIQYIVAVSSMFLLLLVIDLLIRNEVFARAWPSALAWAIVTSALFVGIRYRNMKRGIACGICDRLDRR